MMITTQTMSNRTSKRFNLEGTRNTLPYNDQACAIPSLLCLAYGCSLWCNRNMFETIWTPVRILLMTYVTFDHKNHYTSNNTCNYGKILVIGGLHYR
jgi:hypothetical protein